MYAFILFLFIPATVLSYDVREFYNFRPGAQWIYNNEVTDTMMGKEDFFRRSTIEIKLESVKEKDTGKTFFYSVKDSGFDKQVLGNGSIQETKFVHVRNDSVSVIIKENMSYLDRHPLPISPYYYPFFPFCTFISDSSGDFFTKNDTLFYSRTNDNSFQMIFGNYRVWSVVCGCTYSWTLDCFTDNHSTSKLQLISFSGPISNVHLTNYNYPIPPPCMIKRQINLHGIPAIPSGYYIRINGSSYSVKGQKIHFLRTNMP